MRSRDDDVTKNDDVTGQWPGSDAIRDVGKLPRGHWEFAALVGSLTTGGQVSRFLPSP